VEESVAPLAVLGRRRPDGRGRPGPRVGLLLGLALLPAPAAARPAAPPSLVALLLDTARADRFSVWGHRRPTTPRLDALARDGVRFARHFANSHATRASMPQLMTGRYYHRSVLRPFEPQSHPREYYFLERDPGRVLLPRLLRDAGYHLVGVSAHPWVAPDSRMGEPFHRLEYLPAPPDRGHVHAEPVVDRALALWRERPRDRPTFLYVHLLDLHAPRWPPGDAPEFVDAAVDWRRRFSPGSEPLFDPERRAWDRTDARDFTDTDRAVYRAFYDTVLAYLDGEIGRLIAAVRAEDPALRSVVFAVMADHGEQLGEEGRIKHDATLADAIHHVPLILAGAGIRRGQVVRTFSENVDVAPTLVRVLGLPAPRRAFDGRALLEPDGRAAAARRPAVYYAYSGYQAVRTRRWLLRRDRRGGPDSDCRGGRELLWDVRGKRRRRVPLAGPGLERAAVLRRKLVRRLGPLAERFARGPRAAPTVPFSVATRWWQVESDAVRCVPLDGPVPASAVEGSGWLYVRHGVLAGRPAPPLPVAVTVPDGTYEVAAGVVRVHRLALRTPLLRLLVPNGLHPLTAARFLPLGTGRAEERRLELRLPPGAGEQYRIVALQLTPRAPITDTMPSFRLDDGHVERLRTLGYVD
jgi:arylsulfatase A-like enzyme